MSGQQSGRGGLLQSLLGWDPFRAMYPYASGNAGGMGMEVTRTDDGYNVEIPVPGFRPDDIEVTFETDALVVSGKNERRTFTRVLQLPEEIDPDGITAHVEHGLLCLHLNRRPEMRRRQISVTSGQADHRERTDTVKTVAGESTETGTRAGSSAP